MSEPTPKKALHTVCLTCSGSGDLDRPTARISDDEIVTGIVLEECWFCRGQGWISFGPSHS